MHLKEVGCEEYGQEDNQDRISQLSDPVLEYILSFLTTRDTIQTCLLSKRWTHIWASIPHLFFDNEGVPNFEHFVNTVLRLRDTSSIHGFRLQWLKDFVQYKDGWDHVRKWASYAVMHNVKFLEISIDAREEFIMTLPECLYKCESLEELSLKLYGVGSYDDIPGYINLHRLRRLHLRCYVDQDSVNNLTSGCPILEDLDLEDCWVEDLNFSSNTLKRLSIRNSKIFGTVIQISIPSLQYFNFHHNQLGKITEVLLENLSSLVKASIQIEDYAAITYTSSDADDDGAGPQPVKFISPRSEELSTFHNLKRLKLVGRSISDCFHAVSHILWRSPNLELLTLEKDKYNEFSHQTTHTNNKDATWNMRLDCPHLKIEILVQCGEENERVTELVTEFFCGKCDCSAE